MVRSTQQLEALRDEWDAMAQRFESPLLDHDWFVSCAEAFCQEEDLRVITVRNKQELSAAAPMAKEMSRSGRLMLLGASHLYEPSGWLFSSDEALSELAQRAVQHGEPLILQRVPVESPVCRALTTLPPHQAITMAGGTTTSLAVPITQPWDTYHASLSTRVTENLPRLRRKAERAIGTIRLDERVPKPHEVDALLESFVAVEGSGWKARRGSSLSSRSDLRDFFRRYCHRAALRRRLRVSTLSFGSEVAAVELSVEAYKRMWQLKIGYHDRLALYYPGLQLTAATIRSAFERNLEAYEFLGSAAPWEERWRPIARRYRLLAVYPVSTRGLVGACRDVAGAVWRRANWVWRPAASGSTQ